MHNEALPSTEEQMPDTEVVGNESAEITTDEIARYILPEQEGRGVDRSAEGVEAAQEGRLPNEGVFGFESKTFDEVRMLQERVQSEKEKKEIENRELNRARVWYERARDKATALIAQKGYPYEASVSYVEMHFDDDTYAEGLSLRMENLEDATKSWTMSIDTTQEYLDNRLEDVIERIILKKTTLEQNRVLEGDDVFGPQDFEHLQGKERDKTADEQGLIDLANSVMGAMRTKHNLPALVVPDQAVHVIPKQYWSGEGSAVYAEEVKAIGIREAPANVVFFKKLIHEMLHANIDNSMLPRALNEALVEYVTKEAMREVSSNVYTAGDRARTVRIRDTYSDLVTVDGGKLFSDETYHAYADSAGQIHAENFTYARERVALDRLARLIVRTDVENRFTTPDAVVGEIARAIMSRDQSSLQFIDECLGAGTFDQLREFGNDTEKLEQYLKEKEEEIDNLREE